MDQEKNSVDDRYTVDDDEVPDDARRKLEALPKELDLRIKDPVSDQEELRPALDRLFAVNELLVRFGDLEMVATGQNLRNRTAGRLGSVNLRMKLDFGRLFSGPYTGRKMVNAYYESRSSKVELSPNLGHETRLIKIPEGEFESCPRREGSSRANSSWRP